ncbi:hypothetical protein QVD17_28569 [Tagetes erecta]|uniref:Uncharacterized protein n=1 Tax=Tagetes erecta TaxID=13708 RepID=A0AAD8NSA9_TARER|nr:hypothetical protein QVD17_28569 [Tagetes erecta]
MNIPESEIVPRSSKLPKEVKRSEEQDVKEVLLELEDPESKILIGSGIQADIEQGLISFLKRRKSTFSWKYEDMTAIDERRIMEIDSGNQLMDPSSS